MIRFAHLCSLIAAIATSFLADPGRAAGPVHVNPQPLPPIHWNSHSAGANARLLNVNPQPLPPIHPESRIGGANTPVNVNPQPLPPRS
jgi:hypothetical protein